MLPLTILFEHKYESLFGLVASPCSINATKLQLWLVCWLHPCSNTHMYPQLSLFNFLQFAECVRQCFRLELSQC